MAQQDRLSCLRTYSFFHVARDLQSFPFSLLWINTLSKKAMTGKLLSVSHPTPYCVPLAVPFY